jgi:hypothetical protein
MLLETLLCVAILALAISIIGSQVNESLNAAEYTNNLNRALMLAEWVLAEMDMVSMDDEDRLIELRGEEGEGTFGERYPGFGWRIKIEPTDVEELDLVTLDILVGDVEEDTIDDDWKVIYSAYALRPVVAEVDPTDFGMPSEEEIGMLAMAQPPSAEGVPDPFSGELPAELEELLAALPGPIREIFTRLFGGEPVPLDEIRAAVAELTTEDLLGMLLNPSLLGMLGGMGGLPGGMGALGGLNGLPDVGGIGDLPKALQGGGSGQLPGSLQNLMPGR